MPLLACAAWLFAHELRVVAFGSVPPRSRVPGGDELELHALREHVLTAEPSLRPAARRIRERHDPQPSVAARIVAQAVVAGQEMIALEPPSALGSGAAWPSGPTPLC